jgi:hypothetical protein
VAAHYPSFASAEEMRNSLLATTAMERFRETQAEVREGGARPAAARPGGGAARRRGGRRVRGGVPLLPAGARIPAHPSHPQISTPHQAADRIMEAVAACVDVALPEAYLLAVAEKDYQEKLLGMVGGLLRGGFF